MVKWDDVTKWWRTQERLICMYDHDRECFMIIDKQTIMIMDVVPEEIYTVKRAIYAGSMNINDECGFVISEPGNC